VNVKSDYFISPTKGKLSLKAVIDDITNYLFEDPNSKYRLVIGTDSQRRLIGDQTLTNFVTAIVVHRVGKGGRYFWQNGLKIKTHTLRDKIYKETALSLDLAGRLVPELNKKLNGSKNWELEIHIDVGRVGETRVMIQEVVGMVIGSGYTAKTKPESFAASSVADKHT
jgi:predicted RNase H-related nuclease YkuK (DUF458 family)